MKPLFIYLAIATCGIVVYHIGQKTVPHAGNPMVTLMGVYALAFLMCALASPMFKVADGSGWRAAALSWPVVAIAVGAFLIEFGFLMAYRKGGAVQWSGAAVNAAAAVLLLPLAVLLFRENLSMSKVLGLLMSLGGLVLLSGK